MISIEHKLYPTKKQEAYLEECLFHAVGIENWVINQIKYTLDDKLFPLRYMKASSLRSILSDRIEGHSKKCGLSRRLMTDCIAAVLITYKKHGIDKIRYKSLRKKRSFFFNGDIPLDKKGRLKLPKCKTTFKMSEMNKFQGKLKKVTLIKKYNGWVAVCVYAEERKKIGVVAAEEVGIDPGLKTALVLSDGTEIDFPKHYRENEHLIKKLSRKSKGSKKLKALHNKIKNKRKDFQHKKTTQLAKVYKKIYWSNDNFKSLIQFKNLGKSYADFALGEFRLLLEHKLASRIDELGELVKVDNKNSTQTCSACGKLTFKESTCDVKNRLSVRSWRCIQCGAEHDRDVNAAINTLVSGRGAAAT